MGVIFTKPSCAWAQRDSSCGIVFKLAPAGADYASLGLANNIHGNGIRMSKKYQPWALSIFSTLMIVDVESEKWNVNILSDMATFLSKPYSCRDQLKLHIHNYTNAANFEMALSL